MNYMVRAGVSSNKQALHFLPPKRTFKLSDWKSRITNFKQNPIDVLINVWKKYGAVYLSTLFWTGPPFGLTLGSMIYFLDISAWITELFKSESRNPHSKNKSVDEDEQSIFGKYLASQKCIAMSLGFWISRMGRSGLSLAPKVSFSIWVSKRPKTTSIPLISVLYMYSYISISCLYLAEEI